MQYMSHYVLSCQVMLYLDYSSIRDIVLLADQTLTFRILLIWVLELFNQQSDKREKTKKFDQDFIGTGIATASGAKTSASFPCLGPLAWG